MRIIIRNNLEISNKYIRFIKWKINSVKRKFHDLIYVEIHLNSEGQSPKTYYANIRLGISGHDIVIQNKSRDLVEVFQKSSQAVHRYLAKNKSTKKKLKKRNEVFHKEIN